MRTLSFLLYLLLSVVVYGRSSDKISLPWSIDWLPVDTVKAGDVWDFRAVSAREGAEGADYILYGDSLLSETVDNHRRWYKLDNQTIRLTREESYDYSLVSDAGIPTSCFNSTLLPIGTYYRVKGENSHSNIFLREGEYISYPGVMGKMIIPSGDTIKVAVTMEKCEYVQNTLSNSQRKNLIDNLDFETNNFRDSINSSIKVLYKRWRWFDSSLFPIAVQTHIQGVNTESKELVSEISTHTVDFDLHRFDRVSDSVINSDNVINKEGNNPLSAFLVELNSGRIMLRLGQEAHLHFQRFEVSVVSAGGISYYNRLHEYSGSPIEIPCRTFPAGRYIVSIRSEFFFGKQIINID